MESTANVHQTYIQYASNLHPVHIKPTSSTHQTYIQYTSNLHPVHIKPTCSTSDLIWPVRLLEVENIIVPFRRQGGLGSLSLMTLELCVGVFLHVLSKSVADYVCP
jgi:hypothetical protein